METRIFRDIFNTPDMNWERWINKRALDKKFTWEDMWNKRKRYDQHRSLKLIHRRRKETKNNKLEAPLVSSWESSDKNIDGKEWRDFPSIKGYMIKISESLNKKGGRAGKTKATWGSWNEHRWENLELILRMGRMIGSTWRETHWLKRIGKTISMIKKD